MDVFQDSVRRLSALYGIKVLELNVWRALVAHIRINSNSGGRASSKSMLSLTGHGGDELSAQHVKTTIAIQAIDCAAKRLGYFHNAGYYELADGDFDALFASADYDPRLPPPCIEIVKLRTYAREWRNDGSGIARSTARSPDAAASRQPVPRYRATADLELELLAARPLGRVSPLRVRHVPAVRLGVRAGGAYLRWLETNGEAGLEELAAACDTIAATAKALQFKTARLVSTGRRFEPSRCSRRWRAHGKT